MAFGLTDYFISHKSNEPFYVQQRLDPRVPCTCGRSCSPGRERTVAQDGKVLLLIHGYSVPGYVVFDTDHESCSLMRYFARVRPDAFPDSKAPMHADVALRAVDRVVDFIGALQGVEQVHLLGWS